MPRRKLMIGLVLLCLLLLLPACSTSLRKEKEAAAEGVEEAFRQEAKEANHQTEDISFYLPAGMVVKSDDKYNHLIQKGSKMFILFINPNEDSKSKVLYQTAKEGSKDYLLDKTFRADGRFGYLLIQKLKDDLYEVVVGIGGIKMTTATELSGLSKDAKSMMEIVRSIKMEKE
ncbi:MAG: hypothetical protein C6P37_02940 [Caldibacillus debilis]|uniref:Uncharacterized protein n=2 Tax=Caldibacillus debilis TaxID=301148 RepID=A0A3E0K8G2_9BACI|nr:hypothetical protein [Caldibacillus debilis]MBY6274557.1 hypothetical protein [Bacillaceae bacterium]REJ18270.1 MAG: hypothetical protein C6W57_03795 [Caldibacillus debilis]REJ30386.1 MAG: hypothetical protein C6W56_03155 [Caldibacillus debilis]REJ30679.1 MAG: hypothetical protein C6P37_02940 [Caldibacillus debilis]